VGDGLCDIFDVMGADVMFDCLGFMVVGGGFVEGVDVDLYDVGELMLVVVVFVVLVYLLFWLCGVVYLCGYEFDWLVVFVIEINVFGGDVVEIDDGLCIMLKLLYGGFFVIYDDYWMVMVGVVIGLVVEGVVIENVVTIVKMLLDFIEYWVVLFVGMDESVM